MEGYWYYMIGIHDGRHHLESLAYGSWGRKQRYGMRIG